MRPNCSAGHVFFFTNEQDAVLRDTKLIVDVDSSQKPSSHTHHAGTRNRWLERDGPYGGSPVRFHNPDPH